MPFDPTLPPDGANVKSDVLRTQFNGLKELIDAIPDGPPGPEGPQGPAGPVFAATVVDAVFTVPFGDPATVTTSFDGSAVHFTFQIPAGQPGATGETGTAGEVSAVQLADAIAAMTADSSANTNAVATLDTPMADPDAEALRQAFNTLVLALRR